MSQSCPPENPENSPRAPEFRRTHKYSASTPANMQAYAHRPLPPLPELPLSAPRAKTPPPPPPLRRSASTSGGHSSAFAFQGSFPINRGFGARARTPTSVPRESLSVTVSCPPKPSSSHGSSYAASTWSRRSSQQKVMQLTGMDVDVMDDHPAHPGGEDSDSSSIGSGANLNEPANYETPDCYLVPVLETDLDDASSRGSSWGPMSPELAIVPPPLNIQKQPLRDGIEKHSVSLSDPLTQLHLEDDVIRPWDSAPGQFTDYGAAGEYHRFASQLASRDSRQASDHILRSAMPSKKKRSSLSLALSAASRFRRRSDHPQPIDIGAMLIRPKSSLQNSSKKSQPEQLIEMPAESNQVAAHSLSAPTTPILALATAPPPRPSPAPPLISVWDSDSEEEVSDSHVMSNLKDWLASRNSEDGKLHKRTYSASRAGSDKPFTNIRQDREGDLTISPRERQKRIQMEKAAKRREQMKSHMRVVPEGVMLKSLQL